MAFIATASRQALLSAALLFWLATASRADAPARPHYTLDVSLDPHTHTVRGSVRLVLRAGRAPLRAIWLQLYANAKRSQESVFQQGRELAPEDRGQIELRSLKVEGQERLDEAELELLPGDFTRLRLPLQKPVAPGDAITLTADFVTTLPELASRRGYAGDFHLVAQWYPKLAYLTPEGQFAPHPFERQGEFRANHATYDLTVHAPKGFLVEAAGARLTGGDGGTWRFQSGPGPDVAFAACRTCGARSVRHGDLTVRQLFARGTEAAAARQLPVLREGLDYFARTLGPYPYAQLSAVTTPRSSRVAGMEYPGFVIVPPGPSPVRSSPLIDGRHVAAHELAHQWFYALVGSDELRYPVLDEALTEWAATDLLRSLPDGDTLGLDTFDVMRAATQVGRAPAPPAGLPAYCMGTFTYARSVYVRGALALESVRRSHGDRRFRRALAHYVEANRLTTAAPSDLARAFDGAYGPGFFDRTLGPLLLSGAASNVHLTDVEAHRTGSVHETRIRAHRSGAVALPTWVRLANAEGQTLARLPWPQGQATLEVVARTPDAVFEVDIDPDHALLVDSDHLDQRWQRQRRDSEGHWTTVLFAALQAWLAAWGP